jgi:hypothetical protein
LNIATRSSALLAPRQNLTAKHKDRRFQLKSVTPRQKHREIPFCPHGLRFPSIGAESETTSVTDSLLDLLAYLCFDVLYLFVHFVLECPSGAQTTELCQFPCIINNVLWEQAFENHVCRETPHEIMVNSGTFNAVLAFSLHFFRQQVLVFGPDVVHHRSSAAIFVFDAPSPAATRIKSALKHELDIIHCHFRFPAKFAETVWHTQSPLRMEMLVHPRHEARRRYTF